MSPEIPAMGGPPTWAGARSTRRGSTRLLLAYRRISGRMPERILAGQLAWSMEGRLRAGGPGGWGA
jgi:hypothetical protein